MLAPTIESQKSDIFLRKPCPLLVGACIAGPPTVRGKILWFAAAANAGRASPAPTVKSRNSAYNQAHTLAAHRRGGALLHPRGLAAAQGFSGRAMLVPTIESQKSDIFLLKLCLLLVGACIAGPPMLRSAFGTPAARLSGRKHFPITKKTRKRNRSQVFHHGAPSAGAFRKQCSALFLATGPREANASRTAAQHEPAP